MLMLNYAEIIHAQGKTAHEFKNFTNFTVLREFPEIW